MDMSLSNLRELVMDREAWRAVIMGSQIVRYDWVTELNWIISYVEHLFMCLLSIHKFSLKKCLFRCSAYFLIGLFVFLMLSSMNCFVFWKLIPCQLHHFLIILLGEHLCHLLPYLYSQSLSPAPDSWPSYLRNHLSTWQPRPVSCPKLPCWIRPSPHP